MKRQKPPSVLDAMEGKTPAQRLKHAERLIREAEAWLRSNALGNSSAADVCGGLWELGFDPS